MKSKIFNPLAGSGLLFAGTMLIVLVVISSCQKKETLFQTPENNFAEMTNLLEGEVIFSKITSEQDEEGLALIYGEDLKEEIIALQKITSQTIVSPGTLQNAKLIFSKSGVVVMDMNTKQIWLYPKNDAESRKKFELLKPYLSKNYVSSEIAGTIRIDESFPFFFALSLSDE